MKRNRMFPFFAAMLFFSFVILATSSPTHAATITVCADGCDYETIAGAIGGATADDVIEVSAGTYTEHDITIDKNLTITGDGADTTIVQAAVGENQEQGRVFKINSGVTVTIEDLTVRYGDVDGDPARGGGIYNEGDLTLIHVTVAHNRAKGSANSSAHAYGGGIYSTGPLALTDSTIESNTAAGGDEERDDLGGGVGGGAYVDGNMTVTGGVIRGNTVRAGNCLGDCNNREGYSYGGGIYVENGTLTVSGSAIRDNAADKGATQDVIYEGYGGGVYLDDASADISKSTVSGNSTFQGHSGGISVSAHGVSRHLYIKNSTLSGNWARFYGGGMHIGGATDTRLDNCTVSENYAAFDGGGLLAKGSSTVKYKNTIIHGNITLSSGEDCDIDGGAITSEGHNLFKTGTDCPCDGAGDQTVDDAGLIALADNGGPTQTHALESDSPAVNNAAGTDIDGNPVTADQRGVSRPQGVANDIGAFEDGIYVLRVSKDGNGSGTVTSDTGTIDCGGTCEDFYDGNTQVTLTATAEDKSVFTGWSGDCSGEDPECTVTVDGTKTVTATFQKDLIIVPFITPLLLNSKDGE